MGLEAVELVIRFEEAFGIGIPDQVAAELTTPGKVTDYIFTQLTASEQSACLSQQAFYFLRKRFADALQIQHKLFSPSTRLETLIPLQQRRKVWAGIKSEIGTSALPDLARPTWLFFTLSLLTILTFIFSLIYTRNNFDLGGAAFFVGLLGATLVGYGGAMLTRPLKRHFRTEHGSVGALAKYLTVHSPLTFKREMGWTREQVAMVVREIIIDEVGVNDFTEDSHFINDLHLG